MRALHLAVLGTTLLFGLGSAVIPVMNAEIYVATVPHATHTPVPLVAFVLGFGQAIGKIPLWYAGRGAGWVREWYERRKKKREEREEKAKEREPFPWPRWAKAAGRAVRRWSTAVIDWARADPKRLVVVHFLSGFIMIPPYAVWPTVAGAIGGTWWGFLLASGTGRFLLFLVIGYATSFLPGLFD